MPLKSITLRSLAVLSLFVSFTLFQTNSANAYSDTTPPTSSFWLTSGPSINFQAITSNSAGAGSIAAASGDFNGDGKMDAATANMTAGNVSVFLGNGNGTFLAKVDYATDANPNYIIAVDLNNDGRLDLVTANGTAGTGNTVSVLLGVGNGTFQTHAEFTTGTWPVSIAAADYNLDGNLDLAVGIYSDDTVSVLIGNGNGTFQPKTDISGGGGVASGDFNRDGYPDIVGAQRLADKLSMILGNGDGTFQPKVDYATGTGHGYPAVADLNRDGSLDVAKPNGSTNTMSVLLGNGDGTLQAQVEHSVVYTGPHAAAIGDFNYDGRPDIITACRSSNLIVILPGNGDGTFYPCQWISALSGPYYPVVADFNDDGRDDYVIAALGSSLLYAHLNGAVQYVFNGNASDSPYASNLGRVQFSGDGGGTWSTTSPTSWGIWGEYYNETSAWPSGNPALVRKDNQISFDWGYDSPGSGVGSDNFMIIWKGYILPSYDETYTFYTTTDDGVMLYFSGDIYINDWSAGSTREHSISHWPDNYERIVMKAWDKDWGCNAKLEWASASTGRSVVPNSSLRTFDNWSKTWYLPAADGVYNIKSRAYDDAGNYQTPSAGMSITVDKTPPSSAVTSPTDGSGVRGTSWTVTGTAADNVTGVASVAVSTDGGRTWAAATGTTSWSYTWTLPADGTYVVKSRAKDSNGNIEIPGAGVTVRVDRVSPVSTVTAPVDGAYVGGAQYTITGTASDDSCGVGQVEVSINGDWNHLATDTSGDGSWSSWEYVWTLPSDAAYTINSRATDIAGNVETALSDSVTANLDRTPPTGSVVVNSGAAQTNAQLASLAISATDNLAGVTHMMISNDGVFDTEQWETYATTRAWNLSAGDGAKTVYIKFKDDAGNFNPGSYSDSITLDMTKPSSSITAPPAYISGASYTVAGTASDGTGTGVGSVEVSVDGGAWQPATGTTSWSYSWTLPADGTCVVRSRATDVATNQEVPGSGTSFVVDNNPPVPGTLAVNGGATVVNTSTVDLSLPAADAGTGLSQMRISNDGVFDAEPWEAYSATKTGWDLAAGDGSRTVYAVFRDGASRVSSTASCTVTVDSTMPSSIITSPSATDAFNGTSLTITGTASTVGVSVVQGVEVSTNGGSTWTGATDTSGDGSWSTWDYAWTLPGEGTYTIKSRATNDLGTVESVGAGVTVMVDRTAPSAGSVVINSADPITATTTASLAISSTDALSGVTDMSVTNDGTFDTEPWEAFAATRAWTLATGDGTKTVTVRFRDKAGNVSSTSSDTITLDTTGPSTTVSAPASAAGASCTITGTASDVYSTVALVEISTDGGSNYVPLAGTTTWSYTWTLPADGDYTIKTRATDALGNLAAGAQTVVRVDNTGPSSAVVSATDGTDVIKDKLTTFTGTADDGSLGTGIDKVFVSVDSVLFWAEAVVTPGTGTSYNWSFTTNQMVPDTATRSITLRVKSVDTMGNEGPETTAAYNVPRPAMTGIKMVFNTLGFLPAELDPNTMFVDGVFPWVFVDFKAVVDWRGNPPGSVVFMTPKNNNLPVSTPEADGSYKKALNTCTDFGPNGWLKAYAVSANGQTTEQYVSGMRVMPNPTPWPLYVVTVENLYNGNNSLKYHCEIGSFDLPGAKLPAGSVPAKIPSFGGKAMEFGPKLSIGAYITSAGEAKITGGFGVGGNAKSENVETSYMNPKVNPLNAIAASVTSSTTYEEKKLISVANLDVNGYLKLNGIANYKTNLQKWDWGGSIQLGANVSLSQTWPFMLPPPAAIPMFFKLSISADLSAEFALLDWTTDLRFSGNAALDVYLRGTVGVGVDGVLSVAGYFGGGAKPVFKFPEMKLSVSLYINAGVSVKAFIYEQDFELYKGQWDFPSPAPSYAMMGKDVTLEMNEPKLISREYLKRKDAGVFNSRPLLMPVTNAGALPGLSEGVIQSGVFPYSEPDLSSGTKDGIMMTWLQDNTSRASVNRTEAVFSMYDGASWSEPAALDDDGTADFGPEILAFANASTITGAVAAWQDCDHELADPLPGEEASSMEEMTAALDISAAVYDAGTRTWSAPVSINSNGYIDMPPMLAGESDGDVLLVWLANPGNGYRGPLPAPNEIWYCLWDGYSWSAPAKAADFGYPVVKTDLAYNGSLGVLAMSVDMDNDSTTAEDKEIFCLTYDGSSWSQPMRFTDDSAAVYKAVGADLNEYVCIMDHTAGYAATVIGADLNEYRCISDHAAEAGTVIGLDLFEYRCLKAHASSPENEPGAGVDGSYYWEPTGGTGAAASWAPDTQYPASNEPGTGAAYQEFWEETGNAGSTETWSHGSVYASSREPGAGEGAGEYWAATGNTASAPTWSPGTQYVDHRSLIDANPNVAFDGLGRVILTWLAGHEIRYSLDPHLAGSLAASQVVTSPGYSDGAADFKLARSVGGRIVLLWPDASLDKATPGSNLFAAFYDPDSATWGEYRQMTFSKDSERYLSAGFLGNDLLLTVYDKAYIGEVVETFSTGDGDTVDVPVPVDEGSDLCYMSYIVGGDLAMLGGGMVVEPPNPAPGTHAVVYAIVANLGEIAVTQDIPVSFYDDDPSTGALPFASTAVAGGLTAGGMTVVSTTWDVPETTEPVAIYAVVDPGRVIFTAEDDDKNRANDTISKAVMMPDPALDYAGYVMDVSSNPVVTVNIVNAGSLPCEPVELTIRQGAEDGPVLDTVSVPAMDPHGSFETVFNWDVAAIDDPHQSLNIALDEAKAVVDFDRSNNSKLMAVELTKPDIVVTPGAGLYGELGIGAVKDIAVTLANSGSGDLVIDSTSSLDLPFAVVDGAVTEPIILKPFESASVTVRFAPSVVGSYGSALVISSNDPDESAFDAVLSGTCVLPSGSVSVNAGATITRSPEVVLGLAALGYGNDIVKMQVSSDGVFDTEPWLDFGAYMAWQLAGGEGVNLVYARVMDDKGNISDPFSYAITLDTLRPSTAIAGPSDGSDLRGQSVNVYGTADDGAGTGVSQVEISIDDGGWTGVQGTAQWHYDWQLPTDGIYSIKSRATDAAGNTEQPGPEVTVTVDNTRPESVIGSPMAADWLGGSRLTVAGTSSDNLSGVAMVEVSTDGGQTWGAATDTSKGGTWATWSYEWNMPEVNGDAFNLVSRATDSSGNVEALSAGVNVKVDNVRPVSGITAPFDKSTHGGSASYEITGTAGDGSGAGVSLVEVSTDGGATWRTADGTENWSYEWSAPGEGFYKVLSRTADNNGNVEIAGEGIALVMNDNAYQTLWTRQFGTRGDDYANSVAADGSGVYVAGYTEGALDGKTTNGAMDAALFRYDTDGNMVWMRQFGTDGNDTAFAVVADGGGNAYVAGSTSGAFAGQKNAGLTDAFLAKFDTQGALVWVVQKGSPAADESLGVAVDGAGNVIMCGRTAGSMEGQAALGGDDAFVIKLDSSGVMLWARQPGTPAGDVAYAVAAGPDEEVFLAGSTAGALGSGASAGLADAFVMRLGPDGETSWTRQFGTAKSDVAYDLAADAYGGAYVSGCTGGGIGGNAAHGGNDLFVAAIAGDGTVMWTRQAGTAGDDESLGVKVDEYRGVYIAGWTSGVMEQGAWSGGDDMFVVKYSTGGDELWTRQAGTTKIDRAAGIGLDGCGDVYFCGYTMGSMQGVNAGKSDLAVSKLGWSVGHCGNGIQDGGETGVDCGGPDCQPCSEPGPVAGVVLTPSVQSGTVGSQLTWSANATGGTGSYEYSFWRYGPDKTWVNVQGWSDQHSWAWMPAAKDQGGNLVLVQARSAGSGGMKEAQASAWFTVVKAPVGGVSLTPSVQSGNVGVKHTWTASATGGTGGYEYSFWRYGPDKLWVNVRDWSALATWNWTPAPQDEGGNLVLVQVRSGGSGGPKEAQALMWFNVTSPK